MKKRAVKIIIAFILAVGINFPSIWINRILYLISYLFVGLNILKKAIRNITMESMESMKNIMSQRDDLILTYFRSVSAI